MKGSAGTTSRSCSWDRLEGTTQSPTPLNITSTTPTSSKTSRIEKIGWVSSDGPYLFYHSRLEVNQIKRQNTRMEEEADTFKIVVIGSSGVGKTNISTRFVRDSFTEVSQATLGV